MLLLAALILLPGELYAVNGDLTVTGTINAGSGGVKFFDGTTQKTASVRVISNGMWFPRTNEYSITIPPTTGKINLTYKIVPSADSEPIMIGFNDNLTATGTYNLYSLASYSAIAGKIHAGYGRTISEQYNSFDITVSRSFIFVVGDHLSENSQSATWPVIMKGYLKYPTSQEISVINFKCRNAGTTISSIEWKITAYP